MSRRSGAARRPAPQHPVHQYAADVLSGAEVAGPLVRKACERHFRDLEAGHERGLYFDEERADHALAFFELLCFEDGQPFILEPFQVFIVGSLFGWMKRDGRNAFRRYRNAYIEAGKGSGKTPGGAGMLLYLLHADGQKSPECYCAASTRDQANTAFGDCKRMTEESPELRESTDILAHGLYVPDNRGILRPVSSEARGLDGKRVSGALIDEVHLHRTPEVCDKMRAGTKRQREALIIETTNSGVGRNNVCWAHHEYSERVLTGEIEDDSWFAYVCALDPEDYQDDEGVPSLAKVASLPESWRKVNPGLGTILPVSYLEERVREGLGMPSRQSEVLRYNFCVWPGSEQIWIPDEIYMACAVGPDRDLEEELLGETCYAGLDLGRSRDLSALVLLFPPSKMREKWAFLEWLWCPEYDIIERSERDRVPYAQWHREGHLTATPGNVVDFDYIEEDVRALSLKYNVLEWAYDRTFATDLVTRLMKRKLTCVPVGQGSVSMHAPVTEIERLIFGKMIEHRGLPPMRWMMGNVSLYKDRHGGLSIDKERSKEKVDCPQALADAMQRAIPATVEEEQPSCECETPQPDEAGLCVACLRWTAGRGPVSFL